MNPFQKKPSGLGPKNNVFGAKKGLGLREFRSLLEKSRDLSKFF